MVGRFVLIDKYEESFDESFDEISLYLVNTKNIICYLILIIKKIAPIAQLVRASC